MSTYTIQIDDDVLGNQIANILNQAIQRELGRKFSDTGEAIALAVKNLIYEHKDEIIEKVVNKATAEIVRKGLPKLLERMVEDERK